MVTPSRFTRSKLVGTEAKAGDYGMRDGGNGVKGSI